MADAPLHGLTVLDFSKFLPGPYCTWMLGDLGADVIRVEHPAELAKQAKVLGFSGAGTDELRARRARDSFARNKRSIVLNPGNETSRPILLDLIRRADILVEDYRPGVMERMGLGYSALHAINPRLIYASVTLCGHTGPLRDKPGHDPIALALAGALARVGENPDSPQFPGLPIADLLTGSNAVIGILAAIIARGTTGRGQHVDIAMADASLGLVAPALSRAADPTKLPPRGFRRTDIGLWRCADGRFVCTTDMEPRYWGLFCEAIGHPQFASAQFDPGRRAEILETIGQTFLRRTAAAWMQILDAAGTQATIVLEPHEAMQHPHFHARNMVVNLEASDGSMVTQLGSPIKLSGTPCTVRRAGSAPDDDRDEILGMCGGGA